MTCWSVSIVNDQEVSKLNFQLGRRANRTIRGMPSAAGAPPAATADARLGAGFRHNPRHVQLYRPEYS